MTVPGVLLIALLLLMQGCGGSSADSVEPGNPAPPPPAPPPAAAALTLSPSSVSVSASEGSSVSFSLTLSLSEQAAIDTDHIEFEDIGGAGGVGGYVGSFEVLDGSTLRSLPVRFHVGEPPQGQYSGVLRFYLCRDDNCQTTLSGSPFPLPYQITVGPAPPPQIAPGSLALTAEANDTTSADIAVTLTMRQARLGLRVGAADAHGHFDTQVELLSSTGQSPVYSARVRTKPIGMPGTYGGNVTIFLCSLSPCVAANAVLGSQVTVPYVITVTPETTLQPVPTASGLPEWETFQGTETHTGYVPVTLDPSRFTTKWTWTPPDATYWMNPVVTGSGKVVISRHSALGTGVSSLFVIDESGGTTLWRHDFDVSGLTTPPEAPAVWGGRVFLSLHVQDPMRGRVRNLQSFDLFNGTRLFRTETQSQLQTYLAPTVAGGYVYSGGGTYGGLNTFKANTGVMRWLTPLAECNYWTPAVDDNHVYAFTGNTLTVLHRTTGLQFRSIQDTTLDGACRSRDTAPVLPGDGSVVLLVAGYWSDFLLRYDVATSTQLWRVEGSFANNPAIANGTVYVVNTEASRLEARSLATGTLQWTWDLPEPIGRDPSNRPTGNLLVTDNLIFVGTGARTYAVDLDSHAAVWSTPRTGSFALSSNRVLYIATTGYVSSGVLSTGRIDAIELAGAAN